MKKPVLILGARSDIGNAIAHKFAALGYPIQLAARDVSNLDAEKIDLELRYGISVSLHEFDALAWEKHEEFVRELDELPFIAVSAIGLMPKENNNNLTDDEFVKIMLTNYVGPSIVFNILASRFIERGEGVLIGISSVAGERGRASNYAYGSAKAGYTSYLSGLRNRLSKYGVQVITVLPGYVLTKMTAELVLPTLLTAQPNEVADAIVDAVKTKKDIVYVRKIWRLIMCIIRIIPEVLFKKMRI